MMPAGSDRVSFGLRCRKHAEAHPDKTAIVLVPADGPERSVSWAELDQNANRAARMLADHGAHDRSVVAVGLPTSVEHYYATLGAWRLGACVLPVNPALPARERDEILGLARSWRPTVVIGEWDLDGYGVVRPSRLREMDTYDDGPLPDKVPHPGKAIGSGGSTGRSKIILDPKPWAHVPGAWGWVSLAGLRPGQVQLVTGRLHHNLGFLLSNIGLFEGHTLIAMERFDAAHAVDLIERYRVSFAGWAPIVMQRIARLPNVRARDFSSIECFYHSGGPCPPWVKRVWIDLVGPERQWNAFGSAEDKGVVVMRGDDWLEHPEALGRPLHTDLKILDEQGQEVPTGTVGHIFMRNTSPPGPWYPEEPTYEYLGSPPAPATDDGFTSVGDLGYVDEAGYLYLADRRVDMIVSGAANVYPAEVENVLSEHPSVNDVVVIGVPDPEWGRRVHALIEPSDMAAQPSVGSLDAFCRERLVAYKTPKSYEFVARLPRESSGKIRRSAIAAERDEGWTAGMIPVKGHA